MISNTSFPVYRKLANGQSFYKIINETSFLELQLMGTKIIRYEVMAKQYPELLRIKDMIELLNGFEEISEEEFTSILDKREIHF
jgi:hypothetical protein